MQISHITSCHEGETTLLSAKAGKFDLWFRFPAAIPVYRSADPFVVASLLPSMLQATAIEVPNDAPVSVALIENLHRLQEIFHCWNPALQPVEIRCRAAAPPGSVPRVGSFYSGGVDSSYTFVRHAREITDLIVINGFDFAMDAETFTGVVQRLTDAKAGLKGKVLPVHTNFFDFEIAHRLSRNLSYGSSLASIALALGFARVYVPASHSYAELSPEGSHPLTDPLWSNGRTELIHDGAGARRTEKTACLAQHPSFLDRLSVCWEKPDRNCGGCSKCLRTMTTLRLLGISCAAFPPLISAAPLYKEEVTGPGQLEFLKENLQLAIEKQDAEVIKALRSVIRRYELRRGLHALEYSLLRNVVKRIYRKLHPVPTPERPARVRFIDNRTI